MACSFEDFKAEILETKRIRLLTDASTVLNPDEPHAPYLLLASDKYDLAEKFLKDNRYDYRFHTHHWEEGANIIAEIFARPFNGRGDPCYAGVYDWNGGDIKREDTFPAVRMDMAFAIVIGADPEKDIKALYEVFSAAELFPVIILTPEKPDEAA